jgi:hypothetical protein
MIIEVRTVRSRKTKDSLPVTAKAVNFLIHVPLELWKVTKGGKEVQRFTETRW